VVSASGMTRIVEATPTPAVDGAAVSDTSTTSNGIPQYLIRMLISPTSYLFDVATLNSLYFSRFISLTAFNIIEGPAIDRFPCFTSVNGRSGHKASWRELCLQRAAHHRNGSPGIQFS